jgi:hypothetical protein
MLFFKCAEEVLEYITRVVDQLLECAALDVLCCELMGVCLCNMDFYHFVTLDGQLHDSSLDLYVGDEEWLPDPNCEGR